MNQNSGEQIVGGSAQIYRNSFEINDTVEQESKNKSLKNLFQENNITQNPHYINQENAKIEIKFSPVNDIPNQNIKTFNLESFVSLINQQEKNEFSIIFSDVITVYNGAIGGCSCNRKARVQEADNYFQAKIINIDKELLEKIKKILSIDKIFFKDLKDKIFFEI